MTETQSHRYSSESTQRELSNEYQHDRVKMVFKNCCALIVLRMRGVKEASALEVLKRYLYGDILQKATQSGIGQKKF